MLAPRAARIETAPLPQEAEAVVIGGGVGGCSVAYHLARLGMHDVVVVEQHELTDGTTWHSAGFVGQLRSTLGQTRMLMYSAGLYGELAQETGRDPGWHAVGGIRVATTPARVEELRRQAGWARTFGLEMELISPAEAQERFPLLRVDDVLAAAWLPGDGYLDPADLTFTFAAGARRRGVRFCTGTAVTGIGLRDGRVHEVVTSAGTVRTQIVVAAAGAWTPQVGRLAGVEVPIVPMSHQYMVTRPFEPPLEPLPTVRDPDHIVYFRTENGGILAGGYDRAPRPWAVDGVPDGFRRELFDPDAGRFADPLAGARNRLPALAGIEVERIVNGPEAFTADAEFILGESSVSGFWVAAGFCVHGLAAAGGVGKVMAEWIVEGEPEYDVFPMDIRRFGAQYRSRRYTVARALEGYSRYYDIVYPGEERGAGRPLRLSPAYMRLQELGAAFGEKSSWERANWFERNAAAGDESLRPRGWAGENWSPAIGAECLATRDAAALFDETSFSKMDVHGPGALALLNRLCANEIDRPVGSVVYTQLLNRRGGIEADLTVTRLARDRFRLVTGTAFGPHDLAHIRRHMRRDGSVHAEDVTSSLACLGLWGPRARDVLQPLADADLGDDAFPYLTAQQIAVGYVPCLASRVTYVGELGWELYCPTEYGLALWDALWAAGREHGLVAGGYRAIDSLRLEKGYRAWAADITPEITPDEAGLGFAVRLDKAQGFVGRDALRAARAGGGPGRRLCTLTLDDPRSVCLGQEPVRVGGEIRGRVTSGGYGHRIERSIALALMPADAVEPGTRVEVDVFGEWVGAEVAREPLYDPRGERIRG